MKEYIVRIPENEVETVSQILEKFGAEVTPVKKVRSSQPKKNREKKINHWISLAHGKKLT